MYTDPLKNQKSARNRCMKISPTFQPDLSTNPPHSDQLHNFVRLISPRPLLNCFPYRLFWAKLIESSVSSNIAGVFFLLLQLGLQSCLIHELLLF